MVNWKRSRVIWALAFLAPVLLTLFVVGVWPLLRTFYFSATDARLTELDQPFHWKGMANYWNILSDRDWWTAVRNTLVFTCLSVSLETVLGLLIALALNQPFFGRGLLRSAILIPWAIPTVVSAKMWSWMFHDLYGVVNDVLMKIGILHSKVAWLVDDRLTLGAVVFVDVWKTTPFMALLLLAGLQSIPKEVLEAARVDSSSRVRVFFAVVLPLLKPALFVAVIFRALDALRIFDLVYVLTSNKVSTATLSMYARRELIEFQEFGYGSAASVLIFLIIGLLTVVYVTTTRANFSGEAT